MLRSFAPAFVRWPVALVDFSHRANVQAVQAAKDAQVFSSHPLAFWGNELVWFCHSVSNFWIWNTAPHCAHVRSLFCRALLARVGFSDFVPSLLGRYVAKHGVLAAWLQIVEFVTLCFQRVVPICFAIQNIIDRAILKQDESKSTLAVFIPRVLKVGVAMKPTPKGVAVFLPALTNRPRRAAYVAGARYVVQDHVCA